MYTCVSACISKCHGEGPRGLNIALPGPLSCLMNKISLNQRTWVRCGWPQWSLLHCRYESQEPVFAPHSILVLLFNLFFR